MPWHVIESDRCPADRPWAVIANADGEVVACHPSQDAAHEHMAALYANEPQARGRTNMSEHKALTGLEIKDADAGTVQAVFATLGVKDADGDVTVEGAFEDGAAVRISAYGHKTWDGALPVGRGMIRVDGQQALLDGQFFLKTTAGRDTFETVKEMGELQEWSYGYDILEADRGDFEGEKVQFLRRLKVHEVSPVLLGAGVATRTLAVKQRPSFPDEVERVLGDVREIVTRVEGWGSGSESKEGRVLSTANRERLHSLLGALGEAGEALRVLLAESDPEKDRDALMRELLRFEHLRVQL